MKWGVEGRPKWRAKLMKLMVAMGSARSRQKCGKKGFKSGRVPDMFHCFRIAVDFLHCNLPFLQRADVELYPMRALLEPAARLDCGRYSLTRQCGIGSYWWAVLDEHEHGVYAVVL